MARPRNQIPNLKWDKSRQQWIVYVNRKRIWLGADRVQAERQRLLMADGNYSKTPNGSLLFAEALDIYQRHAKGKYARRDYNRIKAACLAAVDVCGSLPADQFRARALKEVRETLIARKTLCRRYINHLIGAIKGAVTWLVSEEILPADSLASVRSVRALEPGAAPDRPPVVAADPVVVAKTLPHLSPTVAAMVKVQMLTGMRPGELVRMRRCDVSTNPETRLDCAGRPVAAISVDGVMIWFYVPPRHKNSHRGKPRAVAIGPEAQKVLAPILMARLPDEYLFRPADAIRGQCGAKTIRPGPCYTVGSYGRAVHRAVLRAGLPMWSVYMLRHLAATVAAERLDAESARLLLGEAAGSRVISIYVDDSIKRAAEAARKVG